MTTVGELLLWWKNFKVKLGFESTAPRIVQFDDDNNGMYAIRKGSRLTGYEFLDLEMSQARWRTKGAAWYRDCMSEDLDAVKRRFDRMNPAKKVNDNGKTI